MKPRILLAVSCLVCAGCVTAPLERYTVNQSLSMTETRYQEVMNALAVVAASRGQNLPSYSLTTSGLANVTATVSMDATTTWAHAARNFSQQILNLAGKHTPELSWTLDPVADPTLLEGAWYACHWAIYGPPGDPIEYQKEFDLLRRPTYRDIIGYGAERDYHLGVFDEQHQIPCGWLGVGPHHCVPHGACYIAHCGHTYVWVMPDQVYHLSEFTLVLLDIATTAPAWYLQQKQQATATVDLGMPGAADATKSTITETWSAAEIQMPDGSTKIVVQPFAEPTTEGAPGENRFVVSQVIEKSTLSLYGPPSDYIAPRTPTPARTDMPQALPSSAPSGYKR
jgi:hypothetical protein